ncbi:hypothetical protein OWP15_11580 [Bacillus paranthracis]|uniref:hypothetical protein n=1 Tax=Bacillus paranthracis TaxID=2026186 RepID=UPI000789E54A|nr:hypothetical protein [Bacillus paranthracis]KYQ01865.1 hypothetical protein B4079_3147 [Bacillus cereus]MDK7473355.1 hypothetical protein [Bacillus paranthracis]
MSSNKEFCPYCHSDLQGEPIPKKSQKAYGTTHFSRKTGISSIEADKIIKWRCPDCGKEWKVK